MGRGYKGEAQGETEFIMTPPPPTGNCWEEAASYSARSCSNIRASAAAREAFAASCTLVSHLDSWGPESRWRDGQRARLGGT